MSEDTDLRDLEYKRDLHEVLQLITQLSLVTRGLALTGDSAEIVQMKKDMKELAVSITQTASEWANRVKDSI